MKRFVQRLRGRGQSRPEPDVKAHPTPIRISKRARTALILAVLVLLGLVIWQVPTVLTTVIGGFALALALSFPVRWLSRLMPRGLAILLSFLLVVGLVVLAALFLVPLVVEQFAALIRAVPGIASTVERYLSYALASLQDRGLLPSDPQQLVSRIREDLGGAVRSAAGSVLGGAFSVITSTVSFAVTLFGVVFIAAYLLVDVRRFEAAIWLHDKALTLEHRRFRLSRYDVDYAPGDTGKLASIARPRLFENPFAPPQPRLFDLGSVGWLRALKLDGYAPRSPRRPQALQDVLVPYLDALRS